MYTCNVYLRTGFRLSFADRQSRPAFASSTDREFRSDRSPTMHGYFGFESAILRNSAFDCCYFWIVVLYVRKIIRQMVRFHRAQTCAFTNVIVAQCPNLEMVDRAISKSRFSPKLEFVFSNKGCSAVESWHLSGGEEVVEKSMICELSAVAIA